MKENKKFLKPKMITELPKGWQIEAGYAVKDNKGNIRGWATHKGLAFLMAWKAHRMTALDSFLEKADMPQ